MKKRIRFSPISAIDTTSFYIGSTIIFDTTTRWDSRCRILHATAGQIDSGNIDDENCVQRIIGHSSHRKQIGKKLWLHLCICPHHKEYIYISKCVVISVVVVKLKKNRKYYIYLWRHPFCVNRPYDKCCNRITLDGDCNLYGHAFNLLQRNVRQISIAANLHLRNHLCIVHCESI